MDTNPGILIAILLSVLLSQYVHAACDGQTPPPLPLPGGTEKVAVTVNDPNLGEVERTFDLHLPAGYSAANPTPLWLDFHGAGAVIGDSRTVGFNHRRVST